MRTISTLRFAAFIITAQLALIQAESHAQTPAQPQPAAQQPAPAPAAPMLLKITHGVTYITGGGSDQEANELKAQEGEFNLQITLNGKNGEHFKNVPLHLQDYKGFELITAMNAGPYFYASIHPGTYHLLVPGTGANTMQNIKIYVPKKGVVKRTIVVNQ